MMKDEQYGAQKYPRPQKALAAGIAGEMQLRVPLSEPTGAWQWKMGSVADGNQNSAAVSADFGLMCACNAVSSVYATRRELSEKE